MLAIRLAGGAHGPDISPLDILPSLATVFAPPPVVVRTVARTILTATVRLATSPVLFSHGAR
jgi:hypothetical protein